MAPAEYDDWVEAAITGYVEQIVGAYRSDPEQTLARARTQFAELLPSGLASPGVYLMVAVDADDAAVGVLWLAARESAPHTAYVYDVEVAEGRRGEGLGRAIMLAAEDLARAEGFTEMGLNVFGPNTVARRLYESLGYTVDSLNLSKTL